MYEYRYRFTRKQQNKALERNEDNKKKQQQASKQQV